MKSFDLFLSSWWVACLFKSCVLSPIASFVFPVYLQNEYLPQQSFNSRTSDARPQPCKNACDTLDQLIFEWLLVFGHADKSHMIELKALIYHPYDVANGTSGFSRNILKHSHSHLLIGFTQQKMKVRDIWGWMKYVIGLHSFNWVHFVACGCYYYLHLPSRSFRLKSHASLKPGV